MVNSLLLLLLSTTAGAQDPTRPLSPIAQPSTEVQNEAPKQIELQLQAIFSGRHAIAIIDGQRYQVGDQVQNYRLSRIKSDRVLLEGQGSPLTLTLFPTLSNTSTP
ncbi:SctD/MshK family protein [Oceanisphaera pacifica]|uniref:MSHA biogenesis protein MshK n=1 Tax=Oceanisphaera pacifica TaxID=2818389 RepID=A0ABS3NDT5_9GAMM|nr:MSHA biogenesis protein MshK [Oceanisphaera pacifica]MBO1518759.1 MSHA biogenesis protein MshK [Oceanisphaera pacifica]